MKPLDELSEVVKKGILGMLSKDWDDIPTKDQVNFLKAGGLEYCQAAGVEVSDDVLRAAGLKED